MRPHLHHMLHDVLIGSGGMLATFLGSIASWQEHLEWSMRICSLGVGMLVGGVTIWSLVKRNKS